MVMKTKGKNISKGKTIRKGRVMKKEFSQVGYTDELNRLDNSAPIESVRGIGTKKGKSYRKKGVSTVGDFRKFLSNKEKQEKEIKDRKEIKKKMKGKFYDKMPINDYENIKHNRLKAIRKIKNPRERIVAGNMLLDDASIHIRDREGDLVVDNSISVSVLEIENKANEEIKSESKYAVINEDGLAVLVDQDKQSANDYLVKSNAKEEKQYFRVEYSSDDELFKLKEQIRRKHRDKAKKQVNKAFNEFDNEYPELLDIKVKRYEELLQARNELANVPKSQWNKGKLDEFMKLYRFGVHGVHSWKEQEEFDKAKGKTEWFLFTKNQMDKRIKEQEDSQIKLKSLEKGNKPLERERIKAEAITNINRANDLNANRRKFLNDRLRIHKEGEFAIRHALPEEAVDNAYQGWVREDRKINDHLHDNERYRSEAGADMRAFQREYGDDLYRSVHPVFDKSINDKSLVDFERRVKDRVSSDGLDIYRNNRKLELTNRREKARLEKIQKELKEKNISIQQDLQSKKTLKIDSFETTDSVWVKLPHEQVIRLNKEKGTVAFARSESEFNQDLKKAKLLGVYEKGDLDPEQLYAYAFWIFNKTGYDTFAEWLVQDREQLNKSSMFIIDSSRFVGMCKTQRVPAGLNSISFSEIKLDDEAGVYYWVNPETEVKTIWDKSSVDKQLRYLRKQKGTPYKPLLSVSVGDTMPMFMNIGGDANISILIAPMQPDKVVEESDSYDDDEYDEEDWDDI